MTTFKKHKLVILPTKDISKFGKIYENNSFHFYTNENKFLDNLAESQHLYILSDDEIKKGDWYLDTFNNQRIKANEFSDHKHYGSSCKKIIATTDSKLHKEGIPNIPIEFLQEWVKNPQEEIKVEYVSYDKKVGSCSNGEGLIVGKNISVKITSNNTINCRLIEDSWDAINNHYNLYLTESRLQGKRTKGFQKWIKENYEVPKPLKK